MTKTQDNYLSQFGEAGALLDGHFLLTSGLHSPRYLQCALVLQHAKITEGLCEALAEQVREMKPDVVLAPALGGIVVSYELGRALGVRGIFAERKDGALLLRRGFTLEAGERVLLAEDVITTGGSVRELFGLVQGAGAEVVGVAAIVERGAGDGVDFGVPKESLIRLNIPAYKPADCPLCKQGLSLVKPGSRDIPGEATSK